MIVGLCSGVLLIRWSHAVPSEQIVILPATTEATEAAIEATESIVRKTESTVGTPATKPTASIETIPAEVTSAKTTTTTTTTAESSTPAQDVVTIRIVSTEPLVWYDPLVLGCATLTLWLVVCQILIRRVPGWGNSTHLIRIINLSSLFYLGMLAMLFWNVTRHGGAVHTVNTASLDRITTEREEENRMDSHMTQERIREPQS